MSRPARAWGALLAAGQGKRFGGGKLAAELAGRPLIAWALATALEAGLERVLVVLGEEAEQLRGLLPADPRLEILLNPRAAQGMGTSLALAARRAYEAGVPACAVLLADQPLVGPALLRAVVEAALSAPAGAAAAWAAGRRGHPVAFDRRHLLQLASLAGDQGGRALLEGLGSELALVPAAELSQLDVDRPADLERARALLAPAQGGLGRALGLEGPGLWAAVGSGGKTSLLQTLAAELAAQGRPVVITTSTRIYPPPSSLTGPPWLLGTDLVEIGALERRLAQGRPLCLASQRQPDGKLRGCSPAQLASLLALPGLWVLCEADGAAGRPLKGWAAHEPALCGLERGVVVVAGASGLGQPLSDQWVHRPREFGQASSLELGQSVTPQALARVLGSPRGPLRGLAVGSKPALLINQAESAPPQMLRDLCACLREQGQWRALLLASLRGRHWQPCP